MSELTVSAATMERTPQKIGEEIRGLTYQAKCMTVYYGVEIGRRLVEAKKMVGHGAWGEWVKNETEFSQSTATRFMKVFEEYGAEQIGIFGVAANSSTLQNISISNALRLLAVPKDEREEFAAEVDAENISARELERAIQERDEARKTVEAMKTRAEVAEQSREKMEQDMRHLKELSKRAKEAEEQKATALAAAEKELADLRERPVDVAVQVQDASPEQLAEAKAAGAAEAEQKHKAALSAKEDDIRKLKEDLRKAREEAKAANLNLKTAELEARTAKNEMAKANKMAQVNSNQNMVKFSVLFQQAQETVNQMADTVGKESAENQTKMKAALNALAQAIEKVACA